MQLPGAEAMHQVNETLRSMTGNLPHAHLTGPGVALELTLCRRQELPIHAAHTTGLTRLFQDAANTVSARNIREGGGCFHCDGTGLARPLCGAMCTAPGTCGASKHYASSPTPARRW